MEINSFAKEQLQSEDEYNVIEIHTHTMQATALNINHHTDRRTNRHKHTHKQID